MREEKNPPVDKRIGGWIPTIKRRESEKLGSKTTKALKKQWSDAFLLKPASRRPAAHALSLRARAHSHPHPKVCSLCALGPTSIPHQYALVPLPSIPGIRAYSHPPPQYALPGPLRRPNLNFSPRIRASPTIKAHPLLSPVSTRPPHHQPGSGESGAAPQRAPCLRRLLLLPVSIPRERAGRAISDSREKTSSAPRRSAASGSLGADRDPPPGRRDGSRLAPSESEPA